MSKEAGKMELCQKCAHAHRKGKSTRQNKGTALPLPHQINIEKTLDLTGEDPRSFKPWSRKKIVLTCDCGRDCVTTRSQINNYKSIKETGEFKCTACWTKERRLNNKASSDTKKLMSNSQKLRRNRERIEEQKKKDLFLKEMSRQRAELDRSSS